MSCPGHVHKCPRVMSRGHQGFCSEIGHVNVLVSCVQRTFLETMFNAIIFFIIMSENRIITLQASYLARISGL
jgi:hypothetical protein